MSKICVFTRSKDNFPTIEELRVAAARNPNTPIIVKISETGESFIYKDGIYPLIETTWTEELKLEAGNEEKNNHNN